MKIIISLIVGGIAIGFLFLEYYPALGGRPSKDKLQTLAQSPNYSQNKFVNQTPTATVSDMKTMATILRDFIKGNPSARPVISIPVEPLHTVKISASDQPRVTWFGHSTVLLEIEGKTVLLDPMFSQTPSPLPPLGGKRFSETLPSEIENLPPIDLVLISHDHYDHLDYDSVVKLKDRANQFYVPLGVGDHLERWGVAPEKIREYDWWMESRYEGLALVATPARHFSGRSLFDRNATLWCSWVIIGQNSRLFFSGDGGYGPHFKEIGEKYGPFDLTLMECGQYDKRWSAIHMMPEETVKAHLDVKGGTLIPIHWGAFSLALHNWTDPIERVTQAASREHIDISTPKIGETVMVGAVENHNSSWWR